VTSEQSDGTQAVKRPSSAYRSGLRKSLEEFVGGGGHLCRSRVFRSIVTDSWRVASPSPGGQKLSQRTDVKERFAAALAHGLRAHHPEVAELASKSRFCGKARLGAGFGGRELSGKMLVGSLLGLRRAFKCGRVSARPRGAASPSLTCPGACAPAIGQRCARAVFLASARVRQL
jgi:hypothetical protein